MLRQLQAIEVPSWLTNLTPETIKHDPFPLRELLRDSLYYPSCGFDSDPIKHIGGNVLSFVYVDYGHTRDVFMNALHFSGYDLVASRFVTENELAPGGWRPPVLRPIDGDPKQGHEHIKAPFCLWAVFQRRGDFPVTHGPLRFSLLFVCADGAATFHALYVANSIAPKAVAVIQPGHGFGYNWTDFTNPTQIFARLVLQNPAGQPEMLLYRGLGHERDAYEETCWPVYQYFVRRFSRTGSGTVGVWSRTRFEGDTSKKLLSERNPSCPTSTETNAMTYCHGLAMRDIDRRALLVYLQGQFEIDWNGCHGIAHWARVRANGLMLAEQTGANRHVVELFAFFHDSRRTSEGVDLGHGRRGSVLAEELRGRFFKASDAEMALLHHACAYHSDGITTGDTTVLTCWDADRLDLGRVGMTPDPRYLGTKAARQESALHKADARAIAWVERQTSWATDRDQHSDKSLPSILLLDSTMTYPSTVRLIRDKFFQLENDMPEGFRDAVARFFRRVGMEKHAHFCAPGPGSPTRWIVFSVHDYLHPDAMELPPSYVVEVRDEEYLESLKGLAEHFHSPS